MSYGKVKWSNMVAEDHTADTKFPGLRHSCLHAYNLEGKELTLYCCTVSYSKSNGLWDIGWAK